MNRTIKPEILDTLAPDAPVAQRLRRDLSLFNAFMGNYRWLAGQIVQHVHPAEAILELGAGTGDFGLFLRNKKKVIPTNYSGLDLWQRPPNWPQEWGWYREDLTKFADYNRYPVLIGNLIIHQFEDAAIRSLFKRIVGGVRVILFCETARRPLHIYQLPIGYLLGMCRESYQDARTSIEGGFLGNELAELMQLDEREWAVDVQVTFLGAYRFTAVRKQ